MFKKKKEEQRRTEHSKGSVSQEDAKKLLDERDQKKSEEQQKKVEEQKLLQEQLADTELQTTGLQQDVKKPVGPRPVQELMSRPLPIATKGNSPPSRGNSSSSLSVPPKSAVPAPLKGTEPVQKGAVPPIKAVPPASAQISNTIFKGGKVATPPPQTLLSAQSPASHPPSGTRPNSPPPSVGHSSAVVAAPMKSNGQQFYPYEQLKAKQNIEALDSNKLEFYLSDEEFSKVLGVDRDTFTAMPLWKQNNKKRQMGLF